MLIYNGVKRNGETYSNFIDTITMVKGFDGRKGDLWSVGITQ